MENSQTYILVHDVGTTGNKTCLYRLGDSLELVDAALEEYPLYVVDNGGIEQDPEEWWQAISQATQAILARSQVEPTDIKAMAFCAQMQGFIPVDKDGNALHRAMSYMDNRGTGQIKRYLRSGALKIEGMHATKLLTSLLITGGVSASVKDPVWKYLWLRENEPDIFATMYKWMDVKDYLVLRSTGQFTFGYDSAHATFLFDSRPNHLKWHASLCDTYDVDSDHLPPVIHATDQAGELTRQAAQELGLPEGLPVFGGGGDLSMITLGAGCFDSNTIHVYIGTSGWVVATVDQRMTDIDGMVASILGAIPGKYNYIAEQETSGRCLQWVRDHLVLDEVGIYLEGQTLPDKDEEYRSLYDYLNDAVETVPPGSGGVIFTPWLHGNRSPFEDPYARGMFFNISLESGKRDLIRAVLEGDAYHKRWMLETVEKKVPFQDTLRLVGGGARSAVWAQILADVTGRSVEIVENPENAGAAGAALTCGVGLGLFSFADAGQMIRITQTFKPRLENQPVYDKAYGVYRQLYAQNRRLFQTLNA